MGWRFVKQPNGRFARFSEIVDTFTHLNMDELEVIDFCISSGLSEKEAEHKVRSAKDDKSFDGKTSRWEECISLIRNSRIEDYKIALEELTT